MYLPTQFTEPRTEELHRIVRDNALGMLVTHTANGLEAHHLPLLLEADQGPQGTLIAHVARANPLWQEVADGDPVLVVFRGAQGYISPNWYPGKHATHRAVPTWNYEAVHAHGTLTVHDEEKHVRQVVARLTHTHEALAEPPGPHRPWRMGDAPPDYLQAMLQSIVGIEVRITRLEGKRKLGQNREAPDREGAQHALQLRGHTALADAMRQASEPRQCS